jgi:hypothetical protein
MMGIFHMSLFSESGLLKQERTSYSALRQAFKRTRLRPRVSRKERRLVKTKSKKYLGSVNFKARTRWTKAFCSEFSRFFHLNKDRRYPDQPLFLVTLTDIFCTTEHKAEEIDVSAFKRRLQAGMTGLSYLGMMEPALYVNVAPGTRWSNKKAVSWHLHLICWGGSRDQMKRRIGKLNTSGKYLGIMYSHYGAHQKEIPDARLSSNENRTFLADKVRYVLKSPRKVYRICRFETVTKDGEVVPGFRQFKSEPKPGDRVTLFRLMKNLTLDQLAVAGGDGTAVMRRIKRRAVLVREPVRAFAAQIDERLVAQARDSVL